jgi:hypothetical protein
MRVVSLAPFVLHLSATRGPEAGAAANYCERLSSAVTCGSHTGNIGEHDVQPIRDLEWRPPNYAERVVFNEQVAALSAPLIGPY